MSNSIYHWYYMTLGLVHVSIDACILRQNVYYIGRLMIGCIQRLILVSEVHVSCTT